MLLTRIGFAAFTASILLNVTACQDPLPPRDQTVQAHVDQEHATKLLTPTVAVSSIQAEEDTAAGRKTTFKQRMTFLPLPLKGIRLVSAREDEGGAPDTEEVGSSASDAVRVEVIPTPIAQKEIEAEEIPTPIGIPKNAKMSRKSPRFQGSRDPIPVAPPVAMTDGPENTPKVATAPKSNRSVANSDSSGQPAGKGDSSGSVLREVLMPEAMGPVDFKTWKKPDLALFFTGQQHGYIEPCGCTGLANQKGGVARRMTFLTELRDQGWEVMPIDAGNLIRRFGAQGEIKFHRSIEALRKMGYVALGFGPDDVRIPSGDLIQEAYAEKPEDALYSSANVIVFDQSLMPNHRIVTQNGVKVGITSILEPKAVKGNIGDEIMVNEPIEAAKSVLAEIQADAVDFTVLTYFGEEKEAEELATAVPGFDLIVVAGGYGEPTYQPRRIEGSDTQIILTGNKGMYVGLVGLYQDNTMKYARVPLTDEFEDAPVMRKLMAEYQFQLRDLGLEGLGLEPTKHPSGLKFVGSETCGECHTTAYAIWQASMHFEATEHLVNPGERGDVPRHFDPECISCHVTGWNPQGYFPYESGYLDLTTSEHLHGNGCENCHGPGSAHVAVETGEVEATDARRAELRAAMDLPLEKAREKCMECHDLDNSPDFHEEGAFDDYWAEVEHYGVD